MSAARSHVGALVARRGREAPELPAFVEGATGSTVSWAQLAAAVPDWDGLGAALGPGVRVALLAANPLELIRGFVAALAAGVVVAPLDAGATASELAAQVARLGLGAVVADPAAAHLAAGMGPLPCWQWDVDGLVRMGGGVAAPPLEAPLGPEPGPPADVALILPSSGTTGDPKLIPLTAAQLLATAEAVAGAHGLGADDTGYSPLPLFHINGLVVGVLTTLVTGGRLVVDRRFSASRFWAAVATHRATWLNLVPAIISILAERDAPAPEVVARIGFARSASAPLPEVVREGFERATGIGVIETYGMTEAASQITANPRDPAERRPGSVGLPVDVDLRVVDRSLRPVPTGDVGQVQIRGGRVVRTYWTPGTAAGGVRTREATGAGGWLSTGDLGRVDDDGYLYLVGRVDDVINRGGEKIFPRHVEEVLLADPAVAAAAVVGRPHPVVGHEPVAFVLPVPGADTSGLAARLEARCAEHLSRAKRPAAIVVADSLPSGPTGKIRHAELRRALAHPEAPPHAPGRTPR